MSEIQPYNYGATAAHTTFLFGANREKYETDTNLFVKLTTATNQSIGKFQIISSERARGVRRQKRETLFSKQHWLDVIFGVF